MPRKKKELVVTKVKLLGHWASKVEIFQWPLATYGIYGPNWYYDDGAVIYFNHKNPQCQTGWYIHNSSLQKYNPYYIETEWPIEYEMPARELMFSC